MFIQLDETDISVEGGKDALSLNSQSLFVPNMIAEMNNEFTLKD
jgi:hypothetical protein